MTSLRRRCRSTPTGCCLSRLDITNRNKAGTSYNGICVLAGPDFEGHPGEHGQRPDGQRQPDPQLRRRRARARDLPGVDAWRAHRRQLPLRQPRLWAALLPGRAGLAGRVRPDRRQQRPVQGEPELLRRGRRRRVRPAARLLEERRPEQPDHQLALPLQRRFLLPAGLAHSRRQQRPRLLRLERAHSGTSATRGPRAAPSPTPSTATSTPTRSTSTAPPRTSGSGPGAPAPAKGRESRLGTSRA